MRGNFRQDVEVLRIFSAFGIVVYHSTGSGLAYAALIVFVVLSMFLSGTERQAVGFRLVFRRANRVLVPWACWFLVYGLINFLRGVDFFPVENGWVAGVFTGPSIHLWYLPFIYMSVLFFDIAKSNFSANGIAFVSPVAGALILFLAPSWRQFSIEMPSPVPQYFHAFAAVFIGVFFSYFHHLPKYKSYPLLLVVMLSVFSVVDMSGVGVSYLVGVVVSFFVLCLNKSHLSGIDISPISRCMLGVYLSHGVFLIAIGKYFKLPSLLLAVAAFVVSTFAVFVFRNHVFARGENNVLVRLFT